jgi:hypothetical protein
MTRSHPETTAKRIGCFGPLMIKVTRWISLRTQLLNAKLQFRSVPKLNGHWLVSMTLGTSSLTPAASSNTLSAEMFSQPTSHH